MKNGKKLITLYLEGDITGFLTFFKTINSNEVNIDSWLKNIIPLYLENKYDELENRICETIEEVRYLETKIDDLTRRKMLESDTQQICWLTATLEQIHKKLDFFYC
jgi:hypothetical protein